MPTIARRTIALAALAVAIIAAAVALDLPSAQAQSDDEQAGRIVARRLDDGRTEFGWQPSGGERVLPRLRYFPADVDHQRWLNSSPVEVGGEEIGRINVRLSEDGRIEFAFTPTDGERILPPSRYFPPAARPNRWLRSTEIMISPPAPPPATDPFTAVSAGFEHTCAIRESGEIECWGSNEGLIYADGQATTTYAGQSTPPAGFTFTAVAAGGHHTCAIRESGEITCWGLNLDGQTDAPAGSFADISAGGLHTCAIREGDAIECWGWNESFRFVDGTFMVIYGGQSDPPAGRFSAVAAADAHSCGLRENGAIACWGLNYAGQTDAPAGSDFSAVSAGAVHTCALRESGEIACWGWNGDGQTDAPAGRFSAVSAGSRHTCAIRESGEIECWGWNNNGQTDAPAGPFSAVSAGGTHTCAIRESGEIECWGINDYGQTDPPAP